MKRKRRREKIMINYENDYLNGSLHDRKRVNGHNRCWKNSKYTLESTRDGARNVKSKILSVGVTRVPHFKIPFIISQ